MATQHILSYLSLFSLLIWTSLFVMAFLGRGWVVLEYDVDLQDLIRLQSNDPSSTSSLDNVMSNYFPQSVSNMRKNLPFDQNSLTTMKYTLYAGFKQFCVDVTFDGNVKVLQAVDATVCFDNDLLTNPEKFDLPSDISLYTKSIFDKLNSGKVAMIFGLIFTAIAIITSLIKPCLLKSKIVQYILYWTIVGVSILSLICAGSAIGYVKKNQDSLETILKYGLQSSGQQYSSLFNMVHRTGNSIYYSAVGILAAVVVAIINVVQFFLLKKKVTDPNYKHFEMKA